MNLQLLRVVQELARSNLNQTSVAATLNMSQSGVSKQLKELEDVLGVDIFARNGRRLTGVTEPGKVVCEIIERILLDEANLREVAAQYANDDVGRLVVATTHTQARYALPAVIHQFRGLYPKVQFAMRQGSPQQIVQMVGNGEAHIGISTEALDGHPDIVTFPYYSWHHIVIAPKDHPVARLMKPSLDEIAAHPIITYDQDYTGRCRIDQAFARAGAAPNVVLTAIDADVIKTYVELGMGLGIVADMAFDPHRDTGLVALECEHWFEPSITRFGLRKGTFLQAFTRRFIELLAPQINNAEVAARLRTRETTW